MINTVALRSRIVLLIFGMPYIYAMPRKREQFHVHLHSAVIHVSLLIHSVLPNPNFSSFARMDTRDEKNLFGGERKLLLKFNSETSGACSSRRRKASKETLSLEEKEIN